MMGQEEIIHLAGTLGGMLIMGIAFVWAIKADTRVLAQRLDTVDIRLEKIDEVLEKLNDQKSRIDVLDERMMAQGRRLDETVRLLTEARAVR